MCTNIDNIQLLSGQTPCLGIHVMGLMCKHLTCLSVMELRTNRTKSSLHKIFSVQYWHDLLAKNNIYYIRL